MTFYLTAFTAALIAVLGYVFGLACTFLGPAILFTQDSRESKGWFFVTLMGLTVVCVTTLIVVGLAYLGGFQ